MTNLTPIMSTFIALSILITMIVKTPHPVHIITLTLAYSINLSMSMAMWKMNFIAPIMFSMIMISGLLIIFLYFSSLVSNAKPQFTKKSTFMIMLIIMATMMFMNLPAPTPIIMSPDSAPLINLMVLKDPMTMMYAPPTQLITLASMIYLLITLICIIKSCSPKTKSMRKIM